MATASSLMTTEELLALPNDGTERWLIAGELRERPMTVRNRFHSSITANVAMWLGNWLREQPHPRGMVLAGEAGVILGRDPDVTVGIDVTYIGSEVMARQTEATTLIEGVPTLAVEVLSPSDTVKEINEKVATYLAARVPHVWVIDPSWETITVYRPGDLPQFLTVRDEITAEPELPGFRAPVRAFFE